MAKKLRIKNTIMREIVDKAIAAGWSVEPTGGGHLKLVSPDGAIVYGSSTPSDKRAALNFRSYCRQAGLEC